MSSNATMDATENDPDEGCVLIPNPQHRYRRPPGECAYCDAHRNDTMMPSHTASVRCESGKHAHCTCDTCF